jgi:cytochrome c peroxidase
MALPKLPFAVSFVFFLGWVMATSSAQIIGPPGGIIGQWPTPATPVGNPPDPNKALLGKALFWDEQLSGDRSMACGSCHAPAFGGNDANGGALHPGTDGLFGTVDDLFGSPGVIRQNVLKEYIHDLNFGSKRQVTPLNAPTQIGAAFFSQLFWDRRAGPDLKDEFGVTVPGFAVNAALEDLVTGPPTSPVEMGHDGILWSAIANKISGLQPLALATNIPLDLQTLLGSTYQQLFLQAFGPVITPGATVTRERIARAIAQYMRTQIPDQAPIDSGVFSISLSAQRGLKLFRNTGCISCHSVNGLTTGPSGKFFNSNDNLFSDGVIHGIGLSHVSAVPVKTPTLRNVALRQRLFSTGQARDLKDALLQQYFVQNPPLGFGGPLPLQDNADLRAFFDSLTDPRVANELPPFDRPTLRAEAVPFQSNQFGPGSVGTGGFIPTMISNAPEKIGNADFKMGLGSSLGGSSAIFAVSRASNPGQVLNGIPIDLDLSQLAIFTTLAVTAGAAGEGTATFFLGLPNSVTLIGIPIFTQWFVSDPASAGGFAASPAAGYTIF